MARIMRLRFVFLCGVVLASISGCSTSGTTANKSRSPNWLNAGTPIALGVKVQPGSRMLGTAFPVQFNARNEIGTQAVLAIDGNVATVVNAYVSALKKHGFTSDRDATCYRESVQTRCSFMAVRPNGLGAAYFELVTQNSPKPLFPTTMFLSISVHDPNVAVTTTTLDEYWSRVAKLPTTPPPATSLPVFPGHQELDDVATVKGGTIPRVGQLIAHKSMDPQVNLKVEPGSVILAPPAPLNEGTLGWITVARVTGNPTAVRDAYLRQYQNRDEVMTSARVVDGKRVLFGSWSVAGGAKLNLVSVPMRDGTSLMLINVQND